LRVNSSELNIVEPKSVNISEYLRENAKKLPEKPALLHPVRITYMELEKEVNRYSFELENSGIKAGSLTILMVPAGPEFFILTFALLRIGAVPVMIDPGMGIKAMSKALTNIRADAFIGIRKAHLLKFFNPSVFKTVKSKIIIGFHCFLEGKSLKKILPYEDKVYPILQININTPAAIFFTSGSTGPAKGVVYTAGNLNSQILATKSQFNIGSDEIDLCTFPLLGLFAICHGNSSVIADMDMIHPSRLNPARVIKNIQDFGCTQMFGSPLILYKLSHFGIQNKIKLFSLRNIITAGAPVHEDILQSFSHLIASNAVVHIPYGATEALPVTDILASERFQSDSEVREDKYGICIGYPVEGLDIRIIQISDNQILSWNDAILMPVNEVGEIVVKSLWVSTEYFNNPEANRLSKIFDAARQCTWHRMGDLAMIDEAGKLWFYGRKSHRVITTETTMFTIPCEAVFNKHPSVSRSALVGITDKMSGSFKPVVCIQPVKGIHNKGKLMRELLELARNSTLTKGIYDILFFNKFPVDPRHNAKIFREKLAISANKRLR
jgi:acyl-CoA synthetase (AMP-forming)/AMP-acid ligase II